VKGKSRDRINEDELDDIDDWNEREDGDPDGDGNGAGGLPSQSQLIEAKRKRREQRNGLFDQDDDKYLDEAEKSLATDGVKIEPFHMREEETDGTGYFDGDTYVFRNNVPAEDGEADAWADTLMRDGTGEVGDDNEDRPTISIAKNRTAKKETESAIAQEDLDALSKEELYKRIVPLLGGAMESIMEAIRRYGKLAKTKFNSKNRRKQQKWKQQQETNGNDNKINVAKTNLDALTGAANALLLKGEVDIYDRTRQDILRMFPSLSQQLQEKKTSADTKPLVTTSKPKWEYQGNEDNKLHGPYTTEQMIAWVRSGYFVGAQRVKIRTLSVQEQADEEEVEPQLSTEDDLLADLMDDDDEEEEEESRPAKKAKDNQSTILVKGEWMWSNEIDYQKYL
jgi:CD2 antigen cytoplasmic tail-binding protein 2